MATDQKDLARYAPSSGCSGCLALLLVPLLLIGVGFAIRYILEAKKEGREKEKAEQRAKMPPHVVTFQYLTHLPEGEQHVDGEPVIVEGYLLSDEYMAGSGIGFSLTERPTTREQLRDRSSVSYSVRVRISCCNNKCQEVSLEPRTPSRVNCQNYREFQEGPNKYFTGPTVYSDSGEMIRGSNVRLHGKLYMQKRSEETNKVDSELVVSKIEEIKRN